MSDVDEKQTKKEAKKAKRGALWNDFKKFIAKGNVLDMSIGVVMGSAFSAIVTAFTNILLALCTWAVPGGLSGLVTVLPALNENQYASSIADGLANSYSITEWISATDTAGNIVSECYTDYYTQYGTTMYYSGMAIIDWGTLINALISFLIIAITLFTIMKVYSSWKNKTQEWKEDIAEYQAKKEAEEAAENGEAPAEEPAPEPEPEPAPAPAPEPEPEPAPVAAAAAGDESTRILEEIRDEIIKLNASLAKED